MQPHRVRAVLHEVRSLTAEDVAQLTATKGRLMRAEAEIAAARSAFDSASTRAEVSQRVTRELETLLLATEGTAAAPSEPPPAASAPQERLPTIAQEVLAFLRLHRLATRSEIVEHLEATRPDINASSLRREFSRLVRKRRLVRVERGVYAFPPETAGGDV